MNYPKLETGMIGEMDNGKVFVVAGDKLIYQDGAYDLVKTFQKNYKSDYHTIAFLTDKAYSFNHFSSDKDKLENLVPQQKKKKMTIAEIEEQLGYKIEIVGDKND